MVLELRLRIILERPPAGVDFGLQQGKGANYRTIQTQRSDGDDLTFEGTVTAKGDRGEGLPNFLGPLTQGPPGGRFLYIDIGKSAGQAGQRVGAEDQGAAVGHLVGDDRAGVGRPGSGPRSQVAGDGEGWRAELCDRASRPRLEACTSHTMTQLGLEAGEVEGPSEADSPSPPASGKRPHRPDAPVVDERRGGDYDAVHPAAGSMDLCASCRSPHGTPNRHQRAPDRAPRHLDPRGPGRGTPEAEALDPGTLHALVRGEAGQQDLGLALDHGPLRPGAVGPGGAGGKSPRTTTR